MREMEEGWRKGAAGGGEEKERRKQGREEVNRAVEVNKGWGKKYEMVGKTYSIK